MHGYIDRIASSRLELLLRGTPAVALLGPRQCGKSTVARRLVEGRADVLFLDLERPADANKLRDPEALFDAYSERLICIDEIQRAPELFPVMRYVIDRHERNGQFLILGSASPHLLKQSSESLAGRIAHEELAPLAWPEVGVRADAATLREYWLRGGFPRSWLAADAAASFRWRLDFLRAFVERDVPRLRERVSVARMEALWHMCAHLHGQELNSAKLAASLGVDGHTVRSYIELLTGSFMARLLQPFHSNLKKRLVKSPKLYLRDTGLLHALLDIETHADLCGHPVRGASWEGLVLDNICALLRPGVRVSFYRTANGAELDIVLEKGSERVAIECKASTEPRVERGFWHALEDVKPRHVWVVAPVESSYPMRQNVTVSPLLETLASEGLRPFVALDSART